MSTLVIAEHDNGTLSAATLNTIAAATQIGGDIDVLVAGSDCKAVAEAASQVAGVAKARLADAPHLAHGLAEPLAALVAEIAGDYSHVLVGATKFGKNMLPRLGGLMDLAPITEITAIESPDTFVRPIYAGNAIATVTSTDATKLVSVRTTSFETPATSGGAGTVEDVAAPADPGLSSFVGQDLTKSERPELTSANIVISGGRGMQSGDNFEMLERIADELGAAVGASRAAVDAGFVPNDYQVGQTGKVVAPDLYVAVGISGAIQHLAGMKDSKVIVAINKDEEAPIFQVADYGLVADLFDALPELEAALKESS